jgi:lysophospholipase L1-like esterase
MAFTRLRPHASRAAVLLAAALALLGAAAAPAHAGPQSPRTAVVAIGDSYISGEAGRWLGNSVNNAGSRDGTDRACVNPPVCTGYDTTRPYGASGDCHRSDTANVVSARLAVDERINLACSGAVSRNVFRAASGGEGQRGEAPQADQLLAVAREKAVRMVVVSVGGNDLGFASIVSACFQAYETRQGPCRTSQQARLDAAVPKAVADVTRAIDEIRAVMAEAGYGAGDFRLVLQTYPSVIPRASEARYAEQGPERTTFGCPFYDEDLTWGRDQAAPQIGGVVKAAAEARGTEVLDLRDAFQGREICARTSREVSPLAPPSPSGSEWGRALSPSSLTQGQTQEVFHPNVFGQQAFGDCLTEVFAAAPGRFACTNTPGAGPEAMVVTRTAAAPRPAGPDTAVRPATPPAPPPSVAAPTGRCTEAPAPTVRAAGRGLRVLVPRGAGAATVDVFQQSRGRRVVGERLVARFARRTGRVAWSGRTARRGLAVTDGIYVVRVRTRARQVRVALVRRGGRFSARPAYARSSRCAAVRVFKLERPVFGGRGNRALTVAVRLDRAARIAVRAVRGGRTVRAFAARSVRPGVLTRLRLPSERIARGDVRVVLRVTAGGRTTEQALVARRL